MHSRSSALSSPEQLFRLDERSRLQDTHHNRHDAAHGEFVIWVTLSASDPERNFSLIEVIVTSICGTPLSRAYGRNFTIKNPLPGSSALVPRM